MTYRCLLFVVASCVLAALPGCSLERVGFQGDGPTPRDGGGIDGGGVDASFDAGSIEEDAGDDGAVIDEDAGFDGGIVEDAGSDAGTAGQDAGRDAGMVDGGCSGPPSCSGGQLTTCVAGAPVVTACALGCAAAGTSCRAVVPSNVGGMVAFTDGTAALDVVNDEVWIAYPDTGLIEVRDGNNPATVLRNVRDAGVGTNNGIRYAQIAGSGGANYGVFVVGSLRVRQLGVLAGSGGTRSLVIVSAGDVLIEGLVTVSGTGFGPGPGGGAGGPAETDGSGAGGGHRGESDSGLGNDDDGGGGGGSHASVGAAGGDSPEADGGAEGSTYGDADLVPLRGGSGGGGGGDDSGGRGGHGGGALQITSATSITVTASGAIDAGGEGGHGGTTGGLVIDSGAGGGGGSGGAILVEAITVTLAAGRVGAPGGAGGQGARCDNCSDSNNGAEGGDGSVLMVPAQGVPSNGSGGGGGAGSTLTGMATAGSDQVNGGGGGGGSGRVRINNATGAGTYTVVPSTTSGLSSVGSVPRTP
ncbi:hypothetical protein [Sandaracinus amylolyticus]|uniref:hypothetical protein n=1 Tax=Sandaracinus amylolyticus TaxID=927083 RepID=UPI001F336DBA|nr:hypothetical protein [Sandaracinus amylolyticus]UJR85291.1 Hypothetical protein I5071_73710 [Sandaracinus amylolyticus]